MVEPTTSSAPQDPNAMIALAAGLAAAAGAIGTAWAQASIGSAAMGMVAERPEKAGNVIIWLALPETIVIIGLAAAFLLIQKINVGPSSGGEGAH